MLEDCSVSVAYQGSRLPRNDTNSPEPDSVFPLLKFSLYTALYCKDLGCDLTEGTDKK